MDWLVLLVGTLAACGRGRGALVRENLVLRQQRAVLTRPTRQRSRLRRRDRLFWLLVRRLWADWQRHLVVVRPDTMPRWHRQGWRLFWWWQSVRPSGRPRLASEVWDLIARLSRENRLWGAVRLRGELRKLGVRVSASSIRRYRWCDAPRARGQTWGTFLRAHAIWAADLVTVQTLTYKTLYVLCFITHGRRAVVHLAVTAHPTASCVWRQLLEATPWGHRPTYLVRDRDRVYGADFVARTRAIGIETLLTPNPGAPRERHCGTGGTHAAERVPRPRVDPERAPPAGGAPGVRGLLQRGAAPPQPGPRDAAADRALPCANWPDLRPPGVLRQY